jgi:hypothetical protein
MAMNKQQRLRNCAEGFLGGLAAVGFEGPFRWAHHQWELSFYWAWDRWAPATRSPRTFPTFQVGGSANGRTSQAREILWTINRNSPFDGYDKGPLNVAPRSLTPSEYLEDYVEGASPAEWMELARAFLAKMGETP